MTPDQITAALREALPDATIDVRSEDNTHFEATVIDEGFAGLRPLARHQKVYQVLGSAVGREIHALALKTLTPDEHSAAGA
ncbi:MAG: BolA family protein [Gammaproteobacteria bacterium]